MRSGHSADIYLQGYMSALYPSSVSTQVFVKNSIKGRLSDCIALGEACLKCNLLFMCLISACCSVVWPVGHNFLKCRKIHPNALTGALVRYTYVGM